MDRMDHDSVDMIFTDTPYVMEYKTNHRSKEADNAREKILQSAISNDSGPSGRAFNRRYFQRCYKILKPGGALYACSKMFAADGENLLELFRKILLKQGFSIANVIIWKKNNWTAGDLEGAFGFMYECIIFAHKGRHKIRGHRWPDVWEFDRVPDDQRWHPHQKPIDLIMRAVTASSDEGDTVFDGCAGSGATGIACAKLGRRAILCEIDKEKFDISFKKVTQILNQDLFA